MFVIKNDKSIHLTRGDIASVIVSANTQDGEEYTFQTGDVVRLKVVARNDYSTTVLEKSVSVESPGTSVTISLTNDDTTIGDVINKPVDYWYEIELNPETQPQTIIGHDESGARIFRLYPEGKESA